MFSSATVARFMIAPAVAGAIMLGFGLGLGAAAPASAKALKKTLKKPAALGAQPAAAPPPLAAAPPALKIFEAPGLSAAEIAHIKRLDAAIAPARDFAIPAEDLARVREGAAAIAKNNAAKARENEAAMSGALGRKLLQWLRLRDGGESPEEIAAFLVANPAWPDRALMARRLEEAYFVKGGPPQTVKAVFADAEPRTAAGLAALAAAHLALGEEERARGLAAKAWRDGVFPDAFEAIFLEKLGDLLAPADHEARLARLLADDSPAAGDRKTRAAAARRVLPRLPESDRKAAEARVAEFLKPGSGEAAAKAPSKEAARDWKLALRRAQKLRRGKKYDDAAKLVLGAPSDLGETANLDAWWGERRALAYEMLSANKPKAAYDLVRDAGPLSVNPAKEQTFTAGWIAFRFLNDPAAAETHFAAMRKAADGPLSRAKADYWQGRVAESKGETDKARDFYRAAARERDTFHGQLAAQKLAPGRGTIEIAPPAPPAPEDIAKFNGSDAVQAAVAAHKAGLDPAIARVFLYHLGAAAKSEGEASMAAHLAEAMGDTQTAVRIAKSAVARGLNLLYYSYPVHPFPSYTPLRAPPETAFLLGVARQESEFNTRTVSKAGAKGLLQVMTVTAKHVCGDYKIKCELNRILTDKPYNTMLASAYIADRMKEFSGSYVLGLAGYNAGPGRARQWIKAFGDPRDPAVDPIDWIERIPFQETREYVAKVLSNIQIYRARIGEKQPPLRLEADLVRGRPAARSGMGAKAASAVE